MLLILILILIYYKPKYSPSSERPDRNLVVQMLWLFGLVYTGNQIYCNILNYFNYESAIVQRTSDKRNISGNLILILNALE